MSRLAVSQVKNRMIMSVLKEDELKKKKKEDEFEQVHGRYLLLTLYIQ